MLQDAYVDRCSLQAGTWDMVKSLKGEAGWGIVRKNSKTSIPFFHLSYEVNM